MAIRVLTYLSPRIIEVLAPTTTISVQELTDEIKDWEDEVENLSFPKLVNTSGKEDLGGGVLVGITAELQNAQIAFEQRPISDSAGTVTTADNGEYLKDSNATFISDGIVPGDTVINTDDGSVATILRVDSETEVYHYQLSDGSANTWAFGDTYKIWNKVQCELNGGNVVAIDENGSAISAFMPSAFTHVIRTSSSSATLSEQADIQHGSYNERVTIDPNSSYSGTTFPKGTARQPVNNLADALLIAVAEGFDHLHFVDDFTFVSGDNVSLYTVMGEGASRTTLTFDAGCITAGTHFEEATIQGTVISPQAFSDCTFLNVTGNTIGTVGTMDIRDCAFDGTITLSASLEGELNLVNCVSGVAGSFTPTFDMNGANVSVVIRGYTGGMEIQNATHASLVSSVDMVSGQVVLGATNTAGSIIVRGNGKLTDTSAGITVVNELINVNNIADGVWNESMAGHTTAGTFGNQVSKKLLTLAKWFGLK